MRERADVRKQELWVTRTNMGPIGRLFGSGDPSGTVAFVVVRVCLPFIALAFGLTIERDTKGLPDTTMDVPYLLGSVVTGCIGFIFGIRR